MWAFNQSKTLADSKETRSANPLAWALRVALGGQAVFLLSLAAGLHVGGLLAGAWAVSAGMTLYFGAYFWWLATWKEVPHATAA